MLGAPQATAEELAAVKGDQKSKKATSAKSKAVKTQRSPQKKDQASPNPGPAKRVKGKQPEEDQIKMIEELRKVRRRFHHVRNGYSSATILQY